MANDRAHASVETAPVPAGLRRVLRQLPMGAAELQAIEAGEIDAVIDYGSANVIVFPAARRALRDTARLATVAARKATLDLPRRNSMLAALPRAEYRLLLPALEQVMLESGDVIHEAGAPIQHVYFPVDCVICLLAEIDAQRVVATGLVGHEGMVGLPLALAFGVSPVRAVVEVAGVALRMPAARFTSEFPRRLQLQRQLYRYAQAKLNQARQTAVCIASHRFEQRLACWLLMISERTKSAEMHLTQDHLAAVLNVRRVSVTLASGSLRARGLISYRRGRISILDREGLERASCHCYRTCLVDAARPQALSSPAAAAGITSA